MECKRLAIIHLLQTLVADPLAFEDNLQFCCNSSPWFPDCGACHSVQLEMVYILSFLECLDNS